MNTIAADGPRRHAVPGVAKTTTAQVVFARQPLLDRDGMLCGYEMKAREIAAGEVAASLTDSSADAAEPRRSDPLAGVDPVVRAAIQPAVREALVGHIGYLDVTRAMLLDESLQMLPPDRFLLDIPPDIEVDSTLISRIVTLHARRYRFVLDHVVEADHTFAQLLPYAGAVKIEFARIEPAMLEKLAGVLRSAGKTLIALGIESQADFEAARQLGFDRFEGYFFARPQSSTARRVSAPRHALLNLLQLLGSEPTVTQLETELKLNPVLVMHLMRLANTSGLTMGRKVETLREAINATGTDRIARWTQLLLYADGRKVALESDPLLQLAATRARFMELAIAQLPSAGRDEADAAFLTGVFSFVDAVFGGSLESTLDVLTLSRPIRAAILSRDGVLGVLLAAIDALERGAWDDVDAACTQLAPLTAAQIAALALEAAAWAGVADRHAEAAGLERLDE
ncbi:EAL and HDOD domain-containing protein [Paraburkholderia sp.]|uniref:EAL and HDOD domain-containing protein n=1 Tax=Paraburkholderia sp. TaxID=1926495 RepID=UPI003D6F167F